MPVQGRNLLSRPGPELAVVLDKALDALAKAFPIPGSHRKDLPPSIRELSRMLTSERGDLARSYWSAPRFAAAYLYFFLPWNIFRLAWLLPGLDIPLRSGSRILDLGSGPLTLPIALWCARPDLRSVPLSFDCVDVASKPMEYGRDVFYALAGKDSPWRIFLWRSPVEKALRAAAAAKSGRQRPSAKGPGAPAQAAYDCIMAGNVLNELCADTAQSSRSTPAVRLEELTGLAFSALAPEGRLFLLEPGTRFGGKLIALARKGALAQGFVPLAPCTHAAACPMLEDEPLPGGRPGQTYSGWCHFIHPAHEAPAALLDLSAKAQLEKGSLALSCLLLHRPKADPQARPQVGGDDDLDDLEALYAEIMAEDGAPLNSGKAQSDRKPSDRPTPATSSALAHIRVISAAIRLPGEEEAARYACCEKGLALVLNAAHVPSGGGVTLPWPEQERRDGKTGALMLSRPAPRPPCKESTARGGASEPGSAGRPAPDADFRKEQRPRAKRTGGDPQKPERGTAPARAKNDRAAKGNVPRQRPGKDKA